ncbi:MAG: ATP-binding cassette domain-containing protein [Acidobacteriota bacterium]
MTSEVPAIQAQGLTKSYGGRPVLQGIDLTVPQGESLVILGPSGGGKSTLLRCLIGLERPDSGTVRLQGIDIFRATHRELRALRRGIGMAFQRGALFGSMTLAGNIDLPLKEHTRLPLSTRKIIARIKLGLVGMEDAMNLFPSQLSGGMRKRGALARAMALDPSLLFFDEPSAGLDPVTAAGLDLLLKRMKEVFKVTLVVVTHEMVSAFSIADRVVLLHNGRFLVSGSPAEVQKSQHPIVRNFLDRVPPDSSLDEGKFGKFFADPQNK